MTAAQIQLILTDLGYDAGEWTSLNDISSIVLEADASLYPDDTIQFRFDNTNEVITTRIGTTQDEVFTPTREVATIEYATVMGIMMAKATSGKSPYKRGASV
jgi:hypothetical protein